MYKIYYLTSILDCFQPRYIGYTQNLDKRISGHINDAKYQKNKSHKTNWINKILKKECRPVLIEIDQCHSEEEACILERQYIQEFRNWYNLTNSTNGGEVSKIYTDGVIEKIRSGLKEYYKHHSGWNKGLRYKFSEERNRERRKKMGDIIDGENNHFYGKKHSYKTRKLLSSIHRKHNYDYKMFYEYYIVQNMDRNEMSKATGLSSKFIGKMIFKYELGPIKKRVYGKLKGKKVKVDDMELMYRYYDHDRI